jgi:hypothetical protein
MANIIRLKRSATASAVPSSGSLVAGELAVNTADGKLYLKKDDTSVVQIGPTLIAGRDITLVPSGNTITINSSVGLEQTFLFMGA